VTPDTYLNTAIIPALHILPRRFDSAEARALVLAIAYQETKLRARRQMGHGPARSHLQFELGGLVGVLKHPASAPAAAAFIHELDYSDLMPDELLVAMEFDGVLAAGLGRLNIATNPAPLPKQAQQNEAWSYYNGLWRPGAPRPLDWPESWAIAWAALD
jgi:hypothetical protein